MLSCPLRFFNDTATTEFYSRSPHDTLPISPFVVTPTKGTDAGSCCCPCRAWLVTANARTAAAPNTASVRRDRKSTRLNSSHANNSYAVFCLKKKECRLPFDKNTHLQLSLSI